LHSGKHKKRETMERKEKEGNTKRKTKKMKDYQKNKEGRVK
jgi:hypothetical protein